MQQRGARCSLHVVAVQVQRFALQIATKHTMCFGWLMLGSKVNARIVETWLEEYFGAIQNAIYQLAAY